MLAFLRKVVTENALTIQELEQRPSLLHVLYARRNGGVSSPIRVVSDDGIMEVVRVQPLGRIGCRFCRLGTQPHFYHAERWAVTVRSESGSRTTFPLYVNVQIPAEVCRTLTRG